MTDRAELEASFLRHLDVLERLLGAAGRRQGLRDADLTDFASWAKARIVADDYAVLDKFRGECALTTYLAVVVTMAAREYRVAQWGRWRPSAAARARGPLAIRLETLVYRDRLRLGEAAQMLRTAGETTLSDRALATLLAELPARVGRRGVGPDAQAPEVALEAVPGDDAADEAVLHHEADDERSRITRQLRDAIDRLPVEDRMLLRLRFWQGSSVADAARILGVPQRPLYRRLERALGELRGALVAAGVSAEAVRALLDEPSSEAAVEPRSSEPASPARTDPRARPSKAASDSQERAR